MKLYKRALSLTTILTLSTFIGVFEPPQLAQASTVSCNPTISSVVATSNVWGSPKSFTISGPGREEAGYVVPVQNRASWVGKGFDQLNADAAAAAAAARPPTSSTTSTPPTPTGTAAEIASQITVGATAGWVVDPVRQDTTPTRGQGSGTQGSPTGTSGFTGSQTGLTGVPLSIPGINATGTAGPGITATPSIPGINATGTAGTFPVTPSVVAQPQSTQLQQIQAIVNSIAAQPPTPGTGATVLHAQLANGQNPFITGSNPIPSASQTITITPYAYPGPSITSQTITITPEPSGIPAGSQTITITPEPSGTSVRSQTFTISPYVYIRPGVYQNPINGTFSTTPLTSPSLTPLPYVNGEVLGISSASSFQSTETVVGSSNQSVDVTPEMSYQGNGIWTDPAGNRMQITINAGQTPNRSATFEPCANSSIQGPIGGLSATNSDSQVDVVGGYNINNGQQFALQALVSINIVSRPSSSGTASSSGATISTDYLAATSVCNSSGSSVFNLKITPPPSAATSYEFFMGGVGDFELKGFSRVNSLSDPSKPAGYGWDTQPANPGQGFKWQVWGISSTGNTMFKSNIVTITARSCPAPAAAATTTPTTSPSTASTARGGASSFAGTPTPTPTPVAQKPGAFKVDVIAECKDELIAKVDFTWDVSSPIKQYYLADVTDPMEIGLLPALIQQSFQYEVEGKGKVHYYRLSALGANSAGQYSGLSTHATRGAGTIEPATKYSTSTFGSDAYFGVAIPDCSKKAPVVEPAPAVTTEPAPAAFTINASATCVDKKPVVMLTWKPSTNAVAFATLQFAPTATVYSNDLPADATSQSFEMLAPTGFEESYSVIAFNRVGALISGTSEVDAGQETIKLQTPDCSPTPSPFTGTITVSCDKGVIATKATWDSVKDTDHYNIYDTSVPNTRTLLASVPASKPFLDLSALAPGRVDIQFSVEAVNNSGHSLADVPARTADPIVLPDCTLPPPPAVTVTPPVATDAITTIPASTSSTTSITIEPTVTDLDSNLTTTESSVTIIEQPTLGTAAVLPDGQIKFTPRQDVTGVDTLVYRVCDSTGLCDDATQTIGVGEVPVASNIATNTPSTDNSEAITQPVSQTPSEVINLSVKAICAGQQPQHILTWNSFGATNTYKLQRNTDKPINVDSTNYIDNNLKPGSVYSYVISSGTTNSNEVKITAQQCAVDTSSTPSATPTPTQSSSKSSTTTQTPTPVATPTVTQTPKPAPTFLENAWNNIKSFLGITPTATPLATPAPTTTPAQTPAPASTQTQTPTLTPALPSTPVLSPTTPTPNQNSQSTPNTSTNTVIPTTPTNTTQNNGATSPVTNTTTPIQSPNPNPAPVVTQPQQPTTVWDKIGNFFGGIWSFFTGK